MPISLCMIVKDEEDLLEASIKSASRYVDDIVVTDTGSKDKTKEIALKNGARVFDFKWCDDFSAARNYSAEHAAYDWVFVLDADEVVVAFDEERIAEFIKQTANLGSVPRTNPPNTDITYETRLYNRTVYKYEGVVHEQLVPIEDKRTRRNPQEIPISLNHYGYSPELMLKKDKHKRNESLLLKELEKNPKDAYVLYQLGKINFSMSADLQKACFYFKESLAQLPDTRLEYVYSLVECYGYALINTGRYEEALSFVKGYSKHYDKKPKFRFLKAVCYQNNGMLNDAIKCYESCLVKKGENSEIAPCLVYYNIGVIYECVGMKDNAKLMYEKCGNYEQALKRLEIMQ